MEWLTIGAVSALWFGVLTSISPCPLATNIAAVSYIGRSIQSPGAVVASGILYTLGRTAAYVILGFIVVKGLLSTPGVAQFLQRYMALILGPMLVIVGLFLFEVFTFRMPSIGGGERLQKFAARSRVLGPVVLGVVFALSLCPISAGLFFGSLVPLSVRYESTVLLPTLYGIGTGLPVVVFAVIIGMGAGSLGKAFKRMQQFEFFARRTTGVVFVLIGLYYIARNLGQYASLFRG